MNAFQLILAISGNGGGNDATGRARWRQWLDAPGATQRVMFVSEMRERRFLVGDPTLQTASAYYSDPARTTSYVATSSTGKYFPYVTWNYASGANYTANGYGRITSC